MNYFEAFTKIKTAIEGAGIPPFDGRLAIQVRLNDEAAGIFYILASDGRLEIEPYDYYDNDADILVDTATLLEIIVGKLNFKKALADSLIAVSGNKDTVEDFFASIPKRKSAAKRTTAKKSSQNKDGKDRLKEIGGN